MILIFRLLVEMCGLYLKPKIAFPNNLFEHYLDNFETNDCIIICITTSHIVKRVASFLKELHFPINFYGSFVYIKMNIPIKYIENKLL